MNSILKISTLFLLLSACKNVSNPQTADKELITKVGLQLIKNGTTDTSVFYYQIINNTALVDTIKLTSNTMYSASLKIFSTNASSQSTNITNEIVNEKNDHLFIYQSPLSTLQINQLDNDNNGKPFGLNSTWNAMGSSALSSIKLWLIHLPSNKQATSPTDAGGSTDVEATFPIVIL